LTERDAAVANHPTTSSLEGYVVRTEAGYHQVRVGERTVVCRTPKRLLGGERTAATAIVIGDRVRLREINDRTGSIEEVLPRDNELVRGAAGGSRYLDVIAANLDLFVAVHSLKAPEFNAARLDRFLVMAEAAEIPAAVCLNKLDLADAAESEAVARVYRSAGYCVILTSAPDGKGMDELRAAVVGKMTVVAGPSGVGKSSLLNRIQPGLRLRTGEISGSTGKGRHTTTTAELLPLSGGGYIADTPGLRELAIRDVEPEDVGWLFPEFRPYLNTCRFSNCSHREEVDCAVRRAVEEGEIAAQRYRSYRRVYEEMVEQKRY